MLDTLRVNSDLGENLKKPLKPPTRKPTQTLRNLSQLDVRAELIVRAHAMIWSLVSFRRLSQERILPSKTAVLRRLMSLSCRKMKN